jgi:hypothetical protein
MCGQFRRLKMTSKVKNAAELWNLSREEAAHDARKLKILAEAIEIIYEKENPTIEDLINLQKFLKGLSCIFRTDDFQCIWANGFVVDFLEEVEIHVS